MRFKILIIVLFIILVACQTSEDESTSEGATTDRATQLVEEGDIVKETAVSSTSLPAPGMPTAPAPNTPTAPSPETSQIEASEDSTPATISTETISEWPEGALVAVSMNSRVAFVLDEIPLSLRDRLAENLLAKPDSFWRERAQRQIKLTSYRLNFRPFFYFSEKGQLPLPPESLWRITLDSNGARRQMVQGHEVVFIDFVYSSTLLTDIDSPAKAEPALSDEGGTWSEPFILPLDPDFLLQRTGIACIDEAGFPPNSYDSENIFDFFDHECTPDSVGSAGCHRTERPSLSCIEALELRVGQVETEMRFERLAWDDELADSVRIGPVTVVDATDITAYEPDLAIHRVIYRYFEPDDCAIVEGAIGGPGWRRLLQFSATIYNTGTEPLHIGPVREEDTTLNVFTYDSCHDHFHFDHYGDFEVDGAGTAVSSKRAFCVESTNRFSNNEVSPLTHPYTCRFQGVQVGWVDEYSAGLDTQWIDITDVEDDDITLTFAFNPSQQLCEGVTGLSDAGEILWEPSGLRTESGLPIARPVCEFSDNWQMNNVASIPITLPETGGFVTAPCEQGEMGALRNCGFREQRADLSCSPGQSVTLDLQIAANTPPQVARLCEASTSLGNGTACTFTDSLATVIVSEERREVAFTCPWARSADEPGGLYALYSAPLLSDDDPAIIIIAP